MHLARQALAEGNLGGTADKGDVDAIQFAPDGRCLAVATHDGRIDLWDLPGRTFGPSWQAHQPEPITGVTFDGLRFSPDGR